MREQTEYFEQVTPLPIRSAVDLMRREIPPTQFVIDELIPEGLTVVVAPPKSFKSWLMLQACLCVTAGIDFIGHRVTRSDCLYLALEDSESRLQDRIRKVCKGLGIDGPAPGFYYAVEGAGTVDGDLLLQIQDGIDRDPNIRLVIIDTLQRVRGQRKFSEDAYQADTRICGKLQSFALKHHVSIVVVHHTNKNFKYSPDMDPFNAINGSAGIMGALDSCVLLCKEKRTDKSAVMVTAGRDAPNLQEVITFDNEMRFTWKPEGTVEEVDTVRAMNDYATSMIVAAVRTMMEHPETWSSKNCTKKRDAWKGTSTELIMLAKENGIDILNTQKQIANELQRFENLLLKNDRIAYTKCDNGNGSTLHRFTKY